eukprot:CAMPEP_0206835168 /NCGR_PEP_ID=MMETSP0975-20121206/19261_1 /ASSEMBLY_ACC=CAM_ASM_000399 /TAXON_ID=483370 /ORGANISM="non described non described, Strain CCMP2097" /LENGTH=139 /DNA_ID=CAMNT_0054377567 /DNA_START=116 /DNA_END=531 /DNA_ORIENTATION=+
MADSQSWSPMFNAGWVAQTHKFPKSDIASVEKARASDAVRCLTTYQKEYRPMHARPPPSELPPQVVKRRNFSHVRSSSVIKDDPSAAEAAHRVEVADAEEPPRAVGGAKGLRDGTNPPRPRPAQRLQAKPALRKLVSPD